MSKSKKKWLSRFIGLGLTLIILLAVGEVIVKIIEFFLPQKEIMPFDVIKWIGIVVAVIVITNGLAKYLRTNPSAVSIGFTNIPNFMYDEAFEKEQHYLDKSLIKENDELNKKIEDLEEINIDLIEEVELKAIDLDEVTYISDIFIRHHKNASRLVRSLIQLLDEGKPTWKYEFCNNILDECVTILLEDRADKSSTIYFIEEEELKMFAYNRIEFSSSRERVFKKGEGFAGHIWDVNQTVLINNVNEENEHFQGKFAPKHEYGSILGVPIRIGKKVVGVLCIQSEDPEDFAEDDERTVVFYADMCGLAHFYDKMLISGKE
ncbi:GAF domain-containing protein [Mesobacillus jeotgali]|uniref:GAF domain-containing protein n=1 Tax=Mesobacillus jeotgali TaxID=129985 RepID=UPI0009A62859|nr:GAF domain-containing protein [Mesobacillus jeotgali]